MSSGSRSDLVLLLIWLRPGEYWRTCTCTWSCSRHYCISRITVYIILIYRPTVSLILFMHGCTTSTPNPNCTVWLFQCVCVCASTNMLDMQLYPLDRQALSGVFRICKDSPMFLRAWTIWIKVRALCECKSLIHWDMPCSISICTMIPIASQPCKGVEVETP